MKKLRLLFVLMILGGLFMEIQPARADEVVPQDPNNPESYVELYDEKASADSSFRVMAAVSYTLKVDTTNQVVSAYENGTKLVRQMICSTGKNETPTPAGTFKTSSQYRWGYFTKFDCWAQYWTRFNGAILFHSVIYSKQDESTLVKSSVTNLGSKASHGCVRLQVVDAKWIYDNCKPGTTVTVFAGVKDARFTAAVKAAGNLTGSNLYVKETLPSIGKATITTAGGAVNVRLLASTSSGIVGTLANKTKVDVLKVLSDWIMVRSGSVEGYVSRQYVKLDSDPTPTPTPDPTPVTGKGTIQTAGGAVNVRASASTSAAIKGTLANRTSVDILKVEGDWVLLKSGSLQGYVSKQYVNIAGGGGVPDPGTETPMAKGTVKTSGGTLNLRESANPSARVLAQIPNGTNLDIYAFSGDWVKVRYGGYTGYVSRSYIVS